MNKQPLSSLTLSICCLFALSSCRGETLTTGSEPAARISPNFSPDCFISDTENPIITSGDFSSPLSLKKTTWNDPHIIKEADTYYMYVSSDDNFNHDIKIYRLASNDGKNWHPDPAIPVLQKSEGQWDSQSVETPAVIKLADTYHMFWTGYSDYTNSRDFKIGHAISPDGVNWQKDPSFLLAPSDPFGPVNLDFHQFLVGEPAPVVFNNMIYLYFTAIGGNTSVGTTLQVIGLIQSHDGINWTQPQSVLQPNQNLYPRGQPDYYKGYSTPHAAVLNNKMHLFFDVVRTDASDRLFSQQKIHHAVSENGINGWQQDDKEIIDFTESVWTQTEVRSPAIYLNQGKLLLWYAGHKLSPTALGIGMATCTP